MFGLIGKMRVVAGKRDELIDILGANATSMPGCLSYIVAEDVADADVIWVTEVWDLEESHRGSLQLPEVKAAIARGRPMIAGFDMRVETQPIAGV